MKCNRQLPLRSFSFDFRKNRFCVARHQMRLRVHVCVRRRKIGATRLLLPGLEAAYVHSQDEGVEVFFSCHVLDCHIKYRNLVCADVVKRVLTRIDICQERVNARANIARKRFLLQSLQKFFPRFRRVSIRSYVHVVPLCEQNSRLLPAADLNILQVKVN